MCLAVGVRLGVPSLSRRVTAHPLASGSYVYFCCKWIKAGVGDFVVVYRTTVTLDPDHFPKFRLENALLFVQAAFESETNNMGIFLK